MQFFPELFPEVFYSVCYIGLVSFVSAFAVIVLRNYAAMQKKLLFAFFFMFMLAMPFIGILFALWIIYYLRTVTYEQKVVPSRTIRFDEFFSRFPLVRRQFGESAMYEIMNNEHISISLRLMALTMLSEHTNKLHLSLIKQMLSSTNDEIRLLSFSVVDKTEHALNEKIHNMLQEYNYYKEHGNLKKRSEAAKSLAHLYWELVYFELADEVLTNFLLDEVEKYCKIALETMPENPRLYMLLGRVFFERGIDERAKIYFEKAVEFGKQSGLKNIYFIKPYIAEIEYRLNHFARVKEIMEISKHFELNTKLKPIREMWVQ